MNRSTKLGMIWGATLAGVVAIPALWPMIFFFSADDQSFTGMARAIFSCALLAGVIALAGSLLGGIIGAILGKVRQDGE